MSRLFSDVFRRPAIRGSMVAIFVFGMAGMIGPYRSIVGIQELGLSTSAYAALSFVASAINVIVSIMLGNFADRIGNYRKMMILTCAFGVFGYLMVYVWPTQASFVISALLPLPIFGALNSLLFANARAAMQGLGRQDVATANSGVRAMISLSWVLVPGLTGIALSGASSMLASYLAAGFTCLLCLAIIAFVLSDLPAVETANRERLSYLDAIRQTLSPRISLHVFAIALIFSSLHLSDALMPLIATGPAGGSIGDVGVLFGIIALLEVIFIIAWSFVSRRIGHVAALGAGTCVYAVFLLLLGFVTQPWQLYALIPVAGIGAAAIISIPITYLQDLIANRPGLGSALISVNIFVSAGIAAIILALGTASVGYSGTAMIEAAAAIIGVALLVYLQRRP
jgi:MFS family permease